MSQTCHFRTHAPQQTTPYSITSSAFNSTASGIVRPSTGARKSCESKIPRRFHHIKRSDRSENCVGATSASPYLASKKADAPFVRRSTQLKETRMMVDNSRGGRQLIEGAKSMAEPRTITIVLVHGAFAESLSNWKPVLELLLAKGYKVVAAPNPLRGVSSDAAYISSILNTIDGPIILVGHSYGGAVITNAANGNQSVKALVYVAAFAPDTGESVATLLRRFPGSTVEANTAAPILLADGSRDLYFQPDKFRAQYAADLPETETKLLALTQRPMAERAMTEVSDVAAWKAIPSWFIFGTRDNSIPANLLAFMAERAGSKKTVTIEGASHAVMMSHADAVVELVEQAASAVRGDRSTASP
jgi:pimeloyl-ACP methyl ester carboxylesterase